MNLNIHKNIKILLTMSLFCIASLMYAPDPTILTHYSRGHSMHESEVACRKASLAETNTTASPEMRSAVASDHGSNVSEQDINDMPCVKVCKYDSKFVARDNLDNLLRMIHVALNGSPRILRMQLQEIEQQKTQIEQVIQLQQELGNPTSDDKRKKIEGVCDASNELRAHDPGYGYYILRNALTSLHLDVQSDDAMSEPPQSPR